MQNVHEPRSPEVELFFLFLIREKYIMKFSKLEDLSGFLEIAKDK